MSRPDLLRPTQATMATAATAATTATTSNMRPAAGLATAGFASSTGAGAAGGFGAAFRQVQGDVTALINSGWGDGAGSGDALPSQALGTAAAALRARAAGVIDGPANSDGTTTAEQQEFLATIEPWAADAAKRLGVAPALVSAHAALESGWGQRPVGNSNNLFGIKAGGQWQGAVAAATTTEYEQGVALKKVERFRSYPDQAAAFHDYANLLIDNPRYQQALNTGNDARAFASGLARGGYATDPAYADKLSKLAGKVQQMKNHLGD
ncbi:flagellar biosynthesis protein FlgJ [Massilia sp. Root418]|uniref:glycoside hydrolase family 73 protein n=1 Tax=Massilia sp. Root418 TaxID=1736532 RepID=UPI0006F39FA4|nr:glucosaminidase domain-containing protein [Massilia sp. Root418]KQX01913.1 flagellar biosynthesis protein FlgJ [Massilia sp. Root418]